MIFFNLHVILKLTFEFSCTEGTESANQTHLRGLRRFKEEYTVRKSILVTMDPRPRKTDDQIDILPWKIFLQELWGGKIA